MSPHDRATFSLSAIAVALSLELSNLSRIKRCRPALVSARKLGLTDAFDLALAAQVVFELGKSAAY